MTLSKKTTCSSSNNSWYLVYCKTKQEKVAMENLDRQGYEVFLPMTQVQRRRQGRYQYVIEPMFPCYLFICLNIEHENCSPIRSTRGVVSLVRFGSHPAKVPNDLIEKIRELKLVEIEDLNATPEFNKGTVVRIADGVFSGYEGIFEGHSSERRAAILLMIADRYTRVQMPIDYVDVT